MIAICLYLGEGTHANKYGVDVNSSSDHMIADCDQMLIYQFDGTWNIVLRNTDSYELHQCGNENSSCFEADDHFLVFRLDELLSEKNEQVLSDNGTPVSKNLVLERFLKWAWNSILVDLRTIDVDIMVRLLIAQRTLPVQSLIEAAYNAGLLHHLEISSPCSLKEFPILQGLCCISYQDEEQMLFEESEIMVLNYRGGDNGTTVLLHNLMTAVDHQVAVHEILLLRDRNVKDHHCVEALFELLHRLFPGCHIQNQVEAKQGFLNDLFMYKRFWQPGQVSFTLARFLDCIGGTKQLQDTIRLFNSNCDDGQRKMKALGSRITIPEEIWNQVLILASNPILYHLRNCLCQHNPQYVFVFSDLFAREYLEERIQQEISDWAETSTSINQRPSQLQAPDFWSS